MNSNNNKNTITVNRKRKKEIDQDDDDDNNNNNNNSDFSINPNINNTDEDDEDNENEDDEDEDDDEDNENNISNKSKKSDLLDNSINSSSGNKKRNKSTSSKKRRSSKTTFQDDDDEDDSDDNNSEDEDDTFNNTTLDESYDDYDDDESDDDDNNNSNNHGKVRRKISKTKRQNPIIPPTQSEVDDLVNKSFNSTLDDDEDEEEDDNKAKMEIDSNSNNNNNNNNKNTTTTKKEETITTETTTNSNSNTTNTATTVSTTPVKPKQTAPPTTAITATTTTTTSPQMSKQTRNKTNSPINTQEEQVNEGLYHCDYCQKDISGVVRVRCSVCPDFDLCLECFSVGVEITPHRNFHDYHVVDNMHFPMFTDDWGADEELLLLEAIELYGLGNWNEVSENVGAHSKSPSECKSHYFTYYLNSVTSPIPDTSNILTTKENVHFKRAKATVNDKSKKLNNRSNHGDEGPSGPVTDSVGFMKNRGHFEVEYDNDAEIVVKDLTFEQDDLPADREIKLNVLEGYDQRLEERIRRRNFIVEKGLLDYRKTERKRFKDDKEILNSMKCFLQTISKEEHEQLINGIINEKNIKNRILQLQEYREQGIKTLADGSNFDEDKRKRELDKTMKRSKSEISSYMSNSGGIGVNNSSGFLTNPLGHQYIGSGGSGGSDKSSSSSSSSSTPAIFKTQKQITKEKEDNYLGVGDNRSGIERKHHHASKSRKNAKVEMEGLPNSDALSLKEKQLCTSLRLLPQQYLIVKEALIAESLKHNGSIKPTNATKLIKLPPKTVQKLLEYFENCGWLQIKPDSSSSSSNNTTTTEK